jgi:hypothetical protein
MFFFLKPYFTVDFTNGTLGYYWFVGIANFTMDVSWGFPGCHHGFTAHGAARHPLGSLPGA